MASSLEKAKRKRRIKAWMVLDAKGQPVMERHAWGANFIVAKTAAEATKWNPGERTVRVEIEICEK